MTYYVPGTLLLHVSSHLILIRNSHVCTHINALIYPYEVIITIIDSILTNTIIILIFILEEIEAQRD